MGETAARYFSGLDDLVLVMVDADALGQRLKWEPARDGALFPHLYGQLDTAAAIWAKVLPATEARAPYFANLPIDWPLNKRSATDCGAFLRCRIVAGMMPPGP